ncbi:MAG: dihydroorotate dehydrogenase [Candidatus Omnitrophica bacterium]|nr:dihydroorotate dehydrogenase [Candidatus Omnitrophota bacterium]
MMAVNLGKLKLKNPVMVASGTFGYAEEFSGFMDLRKLGAVITKTITLKPRPGNPMPRTCETPAGMLNSIGLENPGIEDFLKKKSDYLKKLKVPIIVSIASEDSPDEFITLAKRLDKEYFVSAIELNISCPNIKKAGSKRKSEKLIAQDPKATYDLVKKVRKATKKTLITKLSPNVTDITKIAMAAENAGSDTLSLINTLGAMSIDILNKKPKLAAITGGLSGPAIRPVALRMVWEAYRKVKIPLIGLGGIIDTESAIEFFLAGASAVAVGTGNFINPKTSLEIIEGIKKYLSANKIRDIRKITGALNI